MATLEELLAEQDRRQIPGGISPLEYASMSNAERRRLSPRGMEFGEFRRPETFMQGLKRGVVEGAFVGGGIKDVGRKVMAKGLTAWHGSPHDFEKFSMGKVGSGEGAQAFGHGIYFTEKREIAEFYKKELSSKSKGKLYKAALKPQSDEFLLWDEPLSKQSKKLKKAVKGVKELNPRFNKPKSEHFKYLRTEDLTGQGIYRGIAHRKGMSDKEMSDYLHAKGIKGIKYLTGESRGKGKGDFNYVLFSDKDIGIIEKMGLVPLGMMANQSEEPQENRLELLLKEQSLRQSPMEPTDLATISDEELASVADKLRAVQ